MIQLFVQDYRVWTYQCWCGGAEVYLIILIPVLKCLETLASLDCQTVVIIALPAGTVVSPQNVLDGQQISINQIVGGCY